MTALQFFLRSESTLQQIEKALVTNYGDIALACKELRVDLMTVIRWREDDPEVERRLHACELLGWSTIEGVAIERAIKGYEKDVYFQGNVVGTETVYSDTLLKEILKARTKAYKPEAQQPQQIQIDVSVMPRADTYEEWLQVRKTTLGQIEEGDFEEVALPPPTATKSALKDLL